MNITKMFKIQNFNQNNSELVQLGSTMNDAPIHSYPSYMRYQSNFYPQQPLPVSRMTQQDVNSGSMWFRHSGDEDGRISNYQLSVS